MNERRAYMSHMAHKLTKLNSGEAVVRASSELSLKMSLLKIVGIGQSGFVTH
jgi:hypothetical protein